MSDVILDSSAILAILDNGPRAEKLSVRTLSRAVASAVNMAEVQTVLVHRGLASEDAWSAASSPVREVIPFTGHLAQIAGSLALHTKALGLSLGDRACLALGMHLGAPVYTADRAWKQLKLGVELRFLR